MNQRIFVGKKKLFDLESKLLQKELSSWVEFDALRVVNAYDLFNLPQQWDQTVLLDSVTDEQMELDTQATVLAIEFLPGQYDQRADAAQQCFALLGQEDIRVKSSKIYMFWGLKNKDITALKKKLINPIESREKDLKRLEIVPAPQVAKVPAYTHFGNWDKHKLQKFHKEMGYSLGFDDLLFIQEYFKKEQRDPTETELKVLDTYWSDHCRHTTFETEIKKVAFNSKFNKELQNTYDYYLKVRKKMGINKPIRLMDMATIMAKYYTKKGVLSNIDISEEINACSIVINVDEDGKDSPWLLQFKNETHNHPTEVEPYGGASTCIGGAIRDPLSGRAYVYQAMRVSGAGNVLEDPSETLPGKLPQKTITKGAANGYSAYGNQIGVATTHVKEFYHKGYTAKRMEVGFVMGAVPKKWVRREEPLAGDQIILLGGRTGRDGVGGATGSSKELDTSKNQDLSAEVQKGNAPVERKIQRLFRNPLVLECIKRCNDFGAGGVSVAIGEIARGVHINLDKIPTKYAGLNGTELAISESQERMAVVVSSKDVARFLDYAAQENLEATVVAQVTDDEVLRVSWKDEDIVILDRLFLDTNGKRKQSEVCVVDSTHENPFAPKPWSEDKWLSDLKTLNNCSQNGLIQQFDANVGRSTVLAPLGGRYQLTPEQISAHSLPTKGKTTTVSLASFGFDPEISSWNPYWGAYYAVYESVHKLIAAGANVNDIYLSFQEYFERLRDDAQRWGKPFAALLGALQAQRELQRAAIGGKDSMSGSFEDLDVPPTLISFAISPAKLHTVRSSTLQKTDSKLLLFKPIPKGQFNVSESKSKLFYKWLLAQGTVRSARVLEANGLATTLANMAWGNQIGFTVNTGIPLMQKMPCALILEVDKACEVPNNLKEVLEPIGHTQPNAVFQFNATTIPITKALEVWQKGLESVFPTQSNEDVPQHPVETKQIRKHSYTKAVAVPKVLIPIFAGTNSEYDSKKAFEHVGAKVQTLVIRNLKTEWLAESIKDFVEELKQSHVLFIPGGFSMADEPDGSGKFIATFLKNTTVKNAIHSFLDEKKLILGICNGFQALVKSGLLPYGRIKDATEKSPILFHNSLHKHIAGLARVKVVNEQSPWLKGMLNKTFVVPISHGEGRWIASQEALNELNDLGCIATVYVNESKEIQPDLPSNPNGSWYNIEGITSPCGQIYGRMGHPERIAKGLFMNIPHEGGASIFDNAMAYFE